MWTGDTFIDKADPNEVSCADYLALTDNPDLIGGTKMEYYSGKVRIGGFPFYDFVKGYLALRGEGVCPLDEEAKARVDDSMERHKALLARLDDS